MSYLLMLMLVTLAACCPTPHVVAPETPVEKPLGTSDESPSGPTIEGSPPGLRSTIALGGACGPALGECAEDGYCAFAADDACGVAGAGVCTARPHGCFKDCPGVCGCDGVRHCNACVAQERGVSVRHAGACQESPAITP